MNIIFPNKLKAGDEIRVVAPARSLAMPWMNEELKELSKTRFRELGLNLSFGNHVNEINEFDSSSIESRVSDLHEAFRDPNVKMIISVIGGFNSNQILKYLDYELIKNNPKIVCGYSDITAVLDSIFAKTGLVTYYGPHFFSFGNKKNFDYTLEYFKKCFFDDASFAVLPSMEWSDDLWAGKQDDRNFIKNDGVWTINDGEASGMIIGGNLCTLNLLQGTEFMPSIKDSVLFIEDDSISKPRDFDRDLQSLIHLPDFEKVRGLVLGRFQIKSEMTKELLVKIIKGKKELDNIPIIANVDFGHTTPLITFPIGGVASIEASGEKTEIVIIKH